MLDAGDTADDEEGTMQITTLPVYSKLADETAIPLEIAQRLPKGWRLSQHQLETFRALIDPNVDVVINTAVAQTSTQ